MTTKYASRFFGKVANPASGVGAMLKSVVTSPGFTVPLALGGIGVGANMIRDAVLKNQEAKAKVTAYKEMLELHPHLKRRPEAEVLRTFNSLYALNPTLTRDPSIAGALMDKVYDRQSLMGGEDATSNQGLLETAKDLTGIRAQMAQAHRAEAGPGVDFARPMISAGDRFLGLYQNAKQEHGELAQYKAKLREKDEAEHRRGIEDRFKAQTGMPMNAQSLDTIARMGNMAAHPAMSTAVSAYHKDPKGFGHAMKDIEQHGDAYHADVTPTYVSKGTTFDVERGYTRPRPPEQEPAEPKPPPHRMYAAMKEETFVPSPHGGFGFPKKHKKT